MSKFKRGPHPYSSTAPNALSAAFCVALMPLAPVIFMPIYGPGCLYVCRYAPFSNCQTLIFVSRAQVASHCPSGWTATPCTLLVCLMSVCWSWEVMRLAHGVLMHRSRRWLLSAQQFWCYRQMKQLSNMRPNATLSFAVARAPAKFKRSTWAYRSSFYSSTLVSLRQAKLSRR